MSAPKVILPIEKTSLLKIEKRKRKSTETFTDYLSLSSYDFSPLLTNGTLNYIPKIKASYSQHNWRLLPPHSTFSLFVCVCVHEMLRKWEKHVDLKSFFSVFIVLFFQQHANSVESKRSLGERK
jgi:hypothetical protein